MAACFAMYTLTVMLQQIFYRGTCRESVAEYFLHLFCVCIFYTTATTTKNKQQQQQKQQ